MSIQIFGSVVDEMCQAARKVVDLGATLVDINMGCPVRKVVRNGGGSALMCDLTSATRLVGGRRGGRAPCPLTVKMRLGWDHENHSAPELARQFEQVGVAAVIIHGRTRSQGFKGEVDLEGIKRVVEAVERMPIVGNGDVRTIPSADTNVPRDRLRGGLDRPRSARQSVPVPAARQLGRDRRPGTRADLLRNGSTSSNATSAAWPSCEAHTRRACRSARS